MKNRAVIEEMYRSYLEQKKVAKDTIAHNEKRIEEINVFLQSIEDTDTELKIFSPFDADDIYNGRVEHDKAELEKLNEDIKVQEDLIRDLDIRIGQFREMLEDEEVRTEPAAVITADQQTVSPEIFDIQEKERFRLSSNLHDNTVQNLVHVCHGLELASMFIDQDPVRAKLEIEACIKNIHSSINEIRDIIFDLKPMSLDDLGFKACIDNFVDNMKVSYSNVAFEMDVDDIKKDDTFLNNLFIIIKETVVNSLKHSGTSKVIIHVKQTDPGIDILVQDFGKGFDPDKVSDNHFGLSLVKKRVELLNGSFDIFSDSQGTKISIHI